MLQVNLVGGTIPRPSYSIQTIRCQGTLFLPEAARGFCFQTPGLQREFVPPVQLPSGPYFWGCAADWWHSDIQKSGLLADLNVRHRLHQWVALFHQSSRSKLSLTDNFVSWISRKLHEFVSPWKMELRVLHPTMSSLLFLVLPTKFPLCIYLSFLFPKTLHSET